MRGRWADGVAIGCTLLFGLGGAAGCATRSDVAHLGDRLDTLIASVQQIEAGWLECRAHDARGVGGPRRADMLVLLGPDPDVPSGPGSAHEREMTRQLMELQAEILGVPLDGEDAAPATGTGLIQPPLQGELLALRVVDDPVQGRLLRGDLLDARQALPAFWSCRRIPAASHGD